MVVVFATLCIVEDSSAQAESPPAIEIKQFTAVDLAYKKHSGPDWGLGRIYTEIGAAIMAEPSAGPMFTRYVNSSVGWDAATTGIEVGFVDNGMERLPDGFRRKTIPACEAATLNVVGRYGLSHLHRRRVLDWIVSEGYQPGGYALEIYTRSKSGGGPVVEIRIPIERAAAVTAPKPDLRKDGALTDLLSSRDYEQASAVIFPAAIYLSEARRQWVGEVADRLRVLRGIVKAKYAGVGDELEELITPFMDRAEAISSQEGTVATGLGTKTVHSDTYLEARGSSVLRRIDRLVVKSYLKSSTADELRSELLEILLAADLFNNSTGQPPTPKIE